MRLGTCEECHEDFEHPGTRGPVPRLCAEHRRELLKVRSRINRAAHGSPAPKPATTSGRVTAPSGVIAPELSGVALPATFADLTRAVVRLEKAMDSVRPHTDTGAPPVFVEHWLATDDVLSAVRRLTGSTLEDTDRHNGRDRQGAGRPT